VPLAGPKSRIARGEREAIVAEARDALLGARICAYAQGFALIAARGSGGIGLRSRADDGGHHPRAAPAPPDGGLERPAAANAMLHGTNRMPRRGAARLGGAPGIQANGFMPISCLAYTTRNTESLLQTCAAQRDFGARIPASPGERAHQWARWSRNRKRLIVCRLSVGCGNQQCVNKRQTPAARTPATAPAATRFRKPDDAEHPAAAGA
jgi:hypothetical protein